MLAGPGADPAGVAANASGNIAQAFADIASAGMAGKATFVSRGGTPGTTVEEHQIWALVQANNLVPTGVLLCTVAPGNGGGETPIAPGWGVTASGQQCPNGGTLPTGSQLPAWYVVTGLTQGPNVIAANACTVGKSGANTCYVLTDRGTYDYLASGLDTAGAIPSLTILTRGPQAATAPGGADELINYFHAYIVNPSQPNEAVNLTAAQDLIAMLTSASFQSRLSTYLDDTSDPAGPPFVADASPQLTELGLPTTSLAGKNVTVTGTLTNPEPGYPALAAQTVSVDEVGRRPGRGGEHEDRPGRHLLGDVRAEVERLLPGLDRSALAGRGQHPGTRVRRRPVARGDDPRVSDPAGDADRALARDQDDLAACRQADRDGQALPRSGRERRQDRAVRDQPAVRSRQAGWEHAPRRRPDRVRDQVQARTSDPLRPPAGVRAEGSDLDLLGSEDDLGHVGTWPDGAS